MARPNGAVVSSSPGGADLRRTDHVQCGRPDSEEVIKQAKPTLASNDDSQMPNASVLDTVLPMEIWYTQKLKKALGPKKNIL